MAYKRDITERDQVFYGTDRLLRYTVYQGNPSAAEISGGTAVPQNISGWTLEWVLRKKASSEELLIQKATGDGIDIVGVYNADPLVNTQRAEVLLSDTDTYDPTAAPPVSVKPGTYVYALKRMDAGEETILAYGAFTLLQAAAW